MCLIDDGGSVDLTNIISENSKILRDAGCELHFIGHRDNNGPSGARRIAVDYLSQFDFIKWIQVADSDDHFQNNFISKKIEALEKFPDFILFYSDYWEKDESGILKQQMKRPYKRAELEIDCMISNNSMFSLEAYHAAGGYDPKLRVAEDWDLWLRLTQFGDAYHIPEALYYYGAGSNSISKSTNNLEYNLARQYVRQKNQLGSPRPQ